MANNPFTPRFGQRPLHHAGREEILEEFREALKYEQEGNPNLCSCIVGARGTGKTALLAEIRNMAGYGWIRVSTSALPGMLDDILCQARQGVEHLVDKEPKVRVNSLGAGGALQIGWQYEKEPEKTWRATLNDVLSLQRYPQFGLLITVDEVDPSLDEMVTLINTYQHFVGEGKKVALIMAGLPANVSQLISGKSTSFLRRARQHHLGRIADEEISSAFEKTLKYARFKVAPAVLDQAVKAIDGYAYMMQLVGFWSVQEHLKHGNTKTPISEEDISKGVERARIDLRQGVVDATYMELSEGDKRFLEAMLQDEGPSRMTDIVSRMGVTNSYASQYRLRLISQGVISAQGRGKVRFDIPLMRECVRDNALIGDTPFDDLTLNNVLPPEVVRDMREYVEGFFNE